MRLARCGVVPHVVIQSSHLRLGEFESHAAKMLLQSIGTFQTLRVSAGGPPMACPANGEAPTLMRKPDQKG
jgi:hypothetical protein